MFVHAPEQLQESHFKERLPSGKFPEASEKTTNMSPRPAQEGHWCRLALPGVINTHQEGLQHPHAQAPMSWQDCQNLGCSITRSHDEHLRSADCISWQLSCHKIRKRRSTAACSLEAASRSCARLSLRQRAAASQQRKQLRPRTVCNSRHTSTHIISIRSELPLHVLRAPQ